MADQSLACGLKEKITKLETVAEFPNPTGGRVPVLLAWTICF
jgi:hypothetical protein